MRLIFSTLLIILLFSFSSCEKAHEIPVISSLKISLSKVQILADGIDSTRITVLDQEGKDIGRLVTVYFDEKIHNGLTIKSAVPAVSKIYALYKNIKSNEIELQVINDKNLKFVKNVLLEQYTATWCGWCPRAINQIDNLQKTDSLIVHAAMHLNDEFDFGLPYTLFQSFGFEYIPLVHADRSLQLDENPDIISSMHIPVRAGFCINVSGNSSQISAKIRIKFGIKYTETLKMTVYLVHDKLVADQKNFYNNDVNSPFYQKGDTMFNFIHRNVVLRIATDLFGETIAGDSIGIGHTYTREISFSYFRCENINDMKVIALITYASGTKINNVLNCIIATIGENRDFVYAN